MAAVEPSQPTLDRHRREILDAIDAPPDLTLLVGVRTSAGVGADLVTAGVRALLGDRPYTEIQPDDLAVAGGHTLLIAAADDGYDRSEDLLPRALIFAESVFARVIVLPSSFDLADPAFESALARSSAIVFAADPTSHERIAALCDARLGLDCAFFADLEDCRAPGTGVLNAFRTSAAARPQGALPAGNDDISLTASGLDGWLSSIARHAIVRTDRRHVAIAAALLGKQVEFATDGDPHFGSFAAHLVTPTADGEAAQQRPRPATLDSRSARTAQRLRRAALATSPPSRPDDAPLPQVTAVVLTRDRPDLVCRALDSLQSTGPAIAVLVIDNASTPASARALAVECAARPDTRLHRSERNLGCAGGRRLATELVDTEFVLFLDDDAELMPGALEHLLAEIGTHPETDAVTATVVLADGSVSHSGGTIEVDDQLATFTLIASGSRFDPAALPPSGPAGWVAGTAVLVRRELLATHPLDDRVAAYYEDNEWCYRVTRTRPDAFRRSREALALHHHVDPKRPDGPSFRARSLAIDLLAANARFHERHGLLMAPWPFHLLPELTAADGSADLAGARVMMELIAAKGADWTFQAWLTGELSGLLTAHRTDVELRTTLATLARTQSDLDRTAAALERTRGTLDRAEDDNARLSQKVASQERTLAFLHERHVTLMAIEDGGWWRLRGRLLPLLRLAGRLRGRATSS